MGVTTVESPIPAHETEQVAPANATDATRRSRTRLRPLATAAAVLVVGAATGPAALASAPPVGPLPAGPTSTIATKKGQLVSVALPHRSGGRSWRIARAFDSKVLREVTEGDVGSTVVVVFKAVRAGRTAIVFALTRGEAAKVYEARRFAVRVTG